MLEITRFTSKICYSQRIISRTVRNKFTKPNVIHALMKEQNECFGALLETKSQKKERGRLKKKEIVHTTFPESEGNSELDWTKRTAKPRLIKLKIDHIDVTSNATSAKNLAKPSNKHEQKNLDAAEGLLLTLQEENPSDVSKVMKRPWTNVKRRLTHKALTVSQTETAVENLVEFNRPRPADVIENICNARLFYNDKESCKIGDSKEMIEISEMENKKYSHYPSVMEILNATMSKTAVRMVDHWMVQMIRELGHEGFQLYTTGLMNNGKLLQSAIENSLRNIPAEVPIHMQRCYEGVESVLKSLTDVKVIGSQVVHEELGYRGVAACVAMYGGNLCLIEWKKSNKTKQLESSTYDAPLQIASCIGALNSDKNYPFQVKSGLLVVVYTLDNKPMLLPIDEIKLQYYWEQWLERLRQYYAMRRT